MTKRTALPRALMALALAAAVPLGACGDDEDDDSGSSGPSAVALELTGSGKQAQMKAPDSVEGGLARITFKNSSKEDGSGQLFRIEGDHTPEEARKVAEAWGDKGKALPEWLLLVGGAGDVRPGASTTVTQSLEPGNYVAADINSSAFAEIEVTEGDAGELPSAPASIDAVDYSFNSAGLKTGKNTVTFANKGKEPHFVVGLPIKPGKTIEDVKKFAQTEKGESPVEEENGTFSTSVVDGGREQLVELELKKGTYAFLCFVPDRKGGPPHVAKGMVSEAVVE